jgi:tetratricopeptide (TPR) repeat protein
MTLDAQLRALEKSGLLRLAVSQPEIEFAFRHALVQDAAYASLVKASRRQLHQAVGEALEALFPDRLRSLDLAPLLGRHFLESGDEARALTYFEGAGDAALGQFANAEAAVHYLQALDIARRVTGGAPAPDSRDWLKRLMRLSLQGGTALERAGRYAEAVTLYAELEGRGRQAGAHELELAGLVAHINVRSIPSKAFDPEQGEALARRGLELSRRYDDRASEGRILWFRMLQSFFAGKHDHVREYGEQALILARELGLLELQASILNDLGGHVYNTAAETEGSQAALAESRAIWRKLGNQHMLSDNLITSAFNAFLRGQFDQALDFLAEAEPIVQRTGNLWGRAYWHGVRGQVYTERGDFKLAMADLGAATAIGELAFIGAPVIARNVTGVLLALFGDIEQARVIGERAVAQAKSHVPFWLPQSLGSLALISLRAGDVAGADRAVREGLGMLTQGIHYAYVHYLMMADCEIGLALNDYARVIQRAEGTGAILRQRDLLAFVPYLECYRGLALQRQTPGDTGPARAALEQAIMLAGRQGSTNAWWRALAALARLERDAGEAGAAEAHLRQARAIIDSIIARIDAPETRSLFLASPDVVAAFGGTLGQ